MERIWFNSKNIRESANKFLKKYPVYNYNKLIDIAENAELEEFRLLCSLMQESSYMKSYISDAPCEERRHIEEACNDRVNKQMGPEALAVFNMFRESQKHEFWCGDERYNLFGNEFAHYAEREIIKSVVVYIVKYKDKPVTLDNIKDISYLYNHGLYWDLYKEPDTVAEPNYNDWETNNAVFNRLNEERKKHVEAWIQFTNYIWDQEWQKAYDFMITSLDGKGRAGWDYM